LELSEPPIAVTVESEPGLVLERRCVLRTLATLLAGVALPGLGPIRLHAADAARPLSLDQFVAEVLPVARALVADVSAAGQDKYLQAVAAVAVRLGEVAAPEMRDSGQGVGPGTFIGAHPMHGEPFVVLHWRLEPGAEIRRHAHSYGNVVTLGLTGAARVENFEMVGERDLARKDRFRVRRTVAQDLTPGSVNLVSLERNYVHGFKTGSDGASGLDITTRLREKQPTPWLDVAARPVEGEDVFEATWTV
jgi:hypothetical protein